MSYRKTEDGRRKMTEAEEIKMLKKQLAEKDKKISDNEKLLAEKDRKLMEQEEKIRRQEIQIENMTQALLHARKKMFGSHTETADTEGQISLFPDLEGLAGALVSEQKKITVPEHKRTPRKEGVRKEMLAALPKEVEEYVIDEGKTCSVCGGKLKVIGKEIVRTEVEFRPAALVVKQVVRQVAKCTECGRTGNGRPGHIEKAAVPAKILSHSIATHSLAAQVMYQKFALGIPFSRQENDFYRLGLVLSRRMAKKRRASPSCGC